MDRGHGCLAVRGEPHVLIVAGSDSSGGAGIVRDIETVTAMGLKSCVAISAVTEQTHTAVVHVELMPAELVAGQMRAALAANRVLAVKIGMLGSAEIVEAVASLLADRTDISVVLDPVAAASSGRPLLEAEAVAAIKTLLIPLCSVVTPNLPELALLAGEAPAEDEAEIARQALALLATGCGAVLAKGGHMSGRDSIDILIRRGHEIVRFGAPRSAKDVRGTGCMLSSAIAAYLVRNATLEDSVRNAKEYVLNRFDNR